MNKGLLRMALAMLAVVLAGTAHAVPFHLDFTGINQNSGSSVGEIVTGGFSFETDRMVRYDYPDMPESVQFVDFQPSGLTEPLAFLNLPGRSITFPTYADYNFLTINFMEDSEGADFYNLYAYSRDSLLPDLPFTGTYSFRSMLFLPLGGAAVDHFESAAAQPTNILGLPIGFLSQVLYGDHVVTCVEGACTSVSENLLVRITSVSGGIGPRTPVPEPGALALLAAGLLGFALSRRLFAKEA